MPDRPHSNSPQGLKGPGGHADVLIQTMKRAPARLNLVACGGKRRCNAPAMSTRSRQSIFSSRLGAAKIRAESLGGKVDACIPGQKRA